MNIKLLPLAFALAAIPLGAQERAPALPLVPRTPPPQQEPAAPAGSYQALMQEFQAAQREWSLGYRKALEGGPDAGRKYASESPQPTQAFIARFAAGAKTHAGADEAVPYLTWLAQNDYANLGRYVDTLLAQHIDDAGIGSIVSMLGSSRDPDTALPALDRVIESSPHAAIRNQALFSRAGLRTRRGSSDELLALARTDYEAVIESGDARLAERARGALFELENLQIGMPAPDIEGEDLDGVVFKLSDYRGKVVVLDFWGDW